MLNTSLLCHNWTFRRSFRDSGPSRRGRRGFFGTISPPGRCSQARRAPGTAEARGTGPGRIDASLVVFQAASQNKPFPL